MKREKKQLLVQFIFANWRWSILLALVLWCGSQNFCDRKECLCSILTLENQTLKIDDRLERICPIEDMSSGTFSIISVQCEHEYRLWIKIDKDAGVYQGRIVKREVRNGTRDKSVENFFSFECIQEYGDSDHKFLGRCWEDDLIDRDDESLLVDYMIIKDADRSRGFNTEK